MTNHEWTDDELQALEKRIKAEYQKAYNETYKEMLVVIQRLQDPDGKLSERKRLALLSQQKRLDSLCKQMANSLSTAGKTAQSLIQSSVAKVYVHSYNVFAEALNFSLITGQDAIAILAEEITPFDKLALEALQDATVIKRRMTSEMVTSLLRGESIPKIAKRLQRATEGNLVNAVRVARTEVTRVESAAAQDVGQHGEEVGFDMGKRWFATKDKRTRPSHKAADRAEVRMDELFEIDSPDGPDLMAYPGDVSHGAGADNVCNCRCRIVPFIIGIKSTETTVKPSDVALLNADLSVK